MDDQRLRLKRRLQEFQLERLKGTYEDFLAGSPYESLCGFFTTHLYNAQDFTARNESFKKLVHAFESAFGTEVLHSISLLLDVHDLSERLDDDVVEHARNIDRGINRHDDSDTERQRETLDRTGSELEQDDPRQKSRDVRVENGRKCLGITRVQSGVGRLPSPQFLADALVDQHVGVYRHPDRQHDAGDAGQRQRAVEEGHASDDQYDVEYHRDVGDHAGHSVVNAHEEKDDDSAQQEGPSPGGDRVATQRGTYRSFFGNDHRRGQRAGA